MYSLPYTSQPGYHRFFNFCTRKVRNINPSPDVSKCSLYYVRARQEAVCNLSLVQGQSDIKKKLYFLSLPHLTLLLTEYLFQPVHSKSNTKSESVYTLQGNTGKNNTQYYLGDYPKVALSLLLQCVLDTMRKQSRV